MDIHHGIYIDIFPYDNLPDDQIEREAFLSKCKKLYQLYVYRTIPDRDAPPQKGLKWMVMASVRRMLHYLVMPIPLSYLEKNQMNYINPTTSKKPDIHPAVSMHSPL